MAVSPFFIVSRGVDVCSIDGSLSIYLYDVLVILPRRGDTELRMDCIYTRQDDVRIAIVPRRLMSRRRLGIQLHLLPCANSTGHWACTTRGYYRDD